MAIGNVLNSTASTAGTSSTSNTTNTTTAATQLSEVQRLLQQKQADTTSANPDANKPYTEQEWFIRARIESMKVQIDFYSRMPDDIGGPVIDHLTSEANKLIKKIQDETAAKQKEFAEKQEQLDKIQREKNEAAQTLTADQLLERAQRRAKGEKLEAYVPPSLDAGTSKDAQAKNNTSNLPSVDKMLENAKKAAAAKGGTVNTTA